MIPPTLYHADSREVLSSYPDDYFDSVVTDPPHEIGFMGKAWDSSGIAFDVSWWRLVLRVLKPGCCLLAKGNGRTYHRMVCAIEDAGFIVEDLIVRLNPNNNPKTKQRLKNANEPIVLARKPGPSAGLQIDAARIPVSDAQYRAKCESVIGLDSNRNGACYGEWTGIRTNSFSELGRWPTNVIPTPEVAAELGNQSRYFYCPRASASEREGLTHPTITPVSLAEYLLKLTTPTGGTALEPFMGSGSFVIAAMGLGLRSVAIERDPVYYAEARDRVRRYFASAV